jgi:hypothetical protein
MIALPSPSSANIRVHPLAALTRERRANFPALDRFCLEVDRYTDGSAADFWKCDAALVELAMGSFLSDFACNELAHCRSNVGHTPLAASGAFIPIARGDFYALSIVIVSARDSRSDRIRSGACHSLSLVAAGADLPVMHYRQPEPEPNDVLRRDARLLPLGEILYRRGDVFRTRAVEDINELRPLPSKRSVVLTLSSKLIAGYAWNYDSGSLLPVGITSDLSWCRTNYALRVIGEIGDVDCLSAVTALTEHPNHFVRWSAIKCAVRLDFDRGLALLEKGANDAHPHVRSAAAATLRRFNDCKPVTGGK